MSLKSQIIWLGHGLSGSALGTPVSERAHSLNSTWVDVLEEHASLSMMHWLHLYSGLLPSSEQLHDTQR